MAHVNVPATRLWNEESVYDAPPGSYFINADRIWYQCPCGCGQPIHLPLNRTGERPSWVWDGSEPVTLTPSIRRLDGCKWHGFLKAGVWEPCSDSGA